MFVSYYTVDRRSPFILSLFSFKFDKYTLQNLHETFYFYFNKTKCVLLVIFNELSNLNHMCLININILRIVYLFVTVILY